MKYHVLSPLSHRRSMNINVAKVLETLQNITKPKMSHACHTCNIIPNFRWREVKWCGSSDHQVRSTFLEQSDKFEMLRYIFQTNECHCDSRENRYRTHCDEYYPQIERQINYGYRQVHPPWTKHEPLTFVVHQATKTLRHVSTH